MSTRRDLPTEGARRALRIGRWLAEPGNSITDIEARHQARFLASVLLLLIALTVTGSVYTGLLVPTMRTVTLTQGAAAALMSMMYLLSRTRYYRWAAWISVSTLFAVPFGVAASVSQTGDVPGSLSTAFLWSALPILLSGVLFSWRGIAVLAAANVVGLLVLPLSITDILFQDVVAPVSLVGGLFGLTLILTRYRDQLERARQTRLSESNRELQAVRSSLEQRVQDRTEELERRARYLEATSRVSREAASMLGDSQVLLWQVVRLISELFGFYHTGLFLVDPSQEWAELRAASSRGGRRMLARRHRLRIGEQGIVGYVAERGEYRIALDVGEDPQFFDNPDLSETRSEMALPLRARGQIIGVLDVQSTEPGAFAEQNVSVLQGLADQVAVAIDNASLFRQVQESAAAERRMRGELSREAWAELLRARAASELCLVSDRQGVFSAGDIWRPEMRTALRTAKVAVSDEDETRLAVPIQVHEVVIGVLNGRKRRGAGGAHGPWTEEEVAAMEELAVQLGQVLDRAQLYQAAQSREARERVTRQMVDQVRSVTEIEDILSVAAQELSRNLNASEVVVRLGTENELLIGDARRGETRSVARE